MLRCMSASLLALFATSAAAAPTSNCPALAAAFRDEPALMPLVDYARMRKCIDAKTWPAPSSSPASAAGSAPARKPLFRLEQQGPECPRLAASYASNGPAGLKDGELSVLKGCVDSAITELSTRPRPGTTANHPVKKTPGLDA